MAPDQAEQADRADLTDRFTEDHEALRDAPEQDGAHPAEPPEYRVARLQRRLATGTTAELGVRADFRGGLVVISAVVPDEGSRAELLAVVRAELAGLTVHTDVTVAGQGPPADDEDLP